MFIAAVLAGKPFTSTIRTKSIGWLIKALKLIGRIVSKLFSTRSFV